MNFGYLFQVEQLDEANTGPTLYGLYDDPACDVVTNWSQTRTISLPAGLHKACHFRCLTRCKFKLMVM